MSLFIFSIFGFNLVLHIHSQKKKKKNKKLNTLYKKLKSFNSLSSLIKILKWQRIANNCNNVAILFCFLTELGLYYFV